MDEEQAALLRQSRPRRLGWSFKLIFGLERLPPPADQDPVARLWLHSERLGLVGCAVCVFSALAVFAMTDAWFGHVAWIWIPIFGLMAIAGATLMLISAFRTLKITKEIRARQRPTA